MLHPPTHPPTHAYRRGRPRAHVRRPGTGAHQPLCRRQGKTKLHPPTPQYDSIRHTPPPIPSPTHRCTHSHNQSGGRGVHRQVLLPLLQPSPHYHPGTYVIHPPTHPPTSNARRRTCNPPLPPLSTTSSTSFEPHLSHPPISLLHTGQQRVRAPPIPRETYPQVRQPLATGPPRHPSRERVQHPQLPLRRGTSSTPPPTFPFIIPLPLPIHSPTFSFVLRPTQFIHPPTHSPTPNKQDVARAFDVILHRGVTGKIYNIGGTNEKANLVRFFLLFFSRPPTHPTTPPPTSPTCRRWPRTSFV